MRFDRVMIAAQREREELGMGIPPAGYKALEAVADVVLAYRPKSKQPKPRKRKKARRIDPLAFACERCGASPGFPCVNAQGRQALRLCAGRKKAKRG